MKRRLFIGSSIEAQDIANQVKMLISSELEDWLNAETWSDGGVFKQNSNALNDLLVASRKFDYGILVASRDDKLWSRLKGYFVPRDNVMFEMGMFLGSLGLTRAFLLVEERTKLPSDYNGATVSFFKRDDAMSIKAAVDKTVKAIQNSQFTFNLKPTASSALALGYFSNFIQPLAKKRVVEGVDFELSVLLPRQLKDLKSEVLSFKAKCPSTEISVYGDNRRPIVCVLLSDNTKHWDIPSTLSTLYTLIDILLPSQEIGLTDEKQEWIDQELRCFAGTIEILVANCSLSIGKVKVSYL